MSFPRTGEFSVKCQIFQFSWKTGRAAAWGAHACSAPGGRGQLPSLDVPPRLPPFSHSALRVSLSGPVSPQLLTGLLRSWEQLPLLVPPMRLLGGTKGRPTCILRLSHCSRGDGGGMPYTPRAHDKKLRLPGEKKLQNAHVLGLVLSFAQ